MTAFGACTALRAALALLGFAVAWAARVQVHVAAPANEHLPLCAQQIVDETCQAGRSALELVSESTGSSQEAVLPLLESLGLPRDASCRAVCRAVVGAIPASSLPRRSDEGCRYDFDKSSVACDVSFLALDSEVLPRREQPAEALAAGTAEGPPQRPVRAGRGGRAGARPRAPAPSRGELLLEVANRFRIYPYSFPATAAAGALLEPAAHQAHGLAGHVWCPDCKGNQQRKIEEARVVAQAILASAIQAMRSGGAAVSGSMKTFFGVDDEPARKKVLSILEQVDVMVKGRVLYENGEAVWDHTCVIGMLSWVDPGDMVDDDTYIIHLCGDFFLGVDLSNAQGITKAGRAGVRAYTLIHELSRHAGMDEVADGGVGVRMLAHQNPERALENADSIALFAQSLHGTFW